MSDINIKMGVSGISQFRSGMKQAQTSVKTLDAELKLNEKQYQATGNAEDYMRRKTELLNAKMDAQKKAVDNAEKALQTLKDAGVDPLSESYQRMQQQLANARGSMLDTQMQMSNIGTRAQAVTKQTKSMGDSLSWIAKNVSFDSVINGLDKLSSGMEKAAQKAVRIGESIFESVVDSAKWADDVQTLAEAFEIPVEKYLKMQALVQGGMDTSVESMLNAMNKMKSVIGKGSKETMDALEELGLAVTVYGGKTEEGMTELVTNDPEEMFWRAGKAIMALDDAFEKEAMAQALFGRSWRDLISLFRNYDSMEEYNAALGDVDVNTEKQVKDLADLNDELGKLKQKFEVLKNDIMAGLAPALTKAAEILSGMLSNLNDYLNSPAGQEALTRMGDALSGIVEDIANIDPEQAVNNFASIITGIADAFTWISKNWKSVEKGLMAIGAAFGTIKVASGVLTFLKTIQGFKGLGGGGGTGGTGGTGGFGGTNTGSTFTGSTFTGGTFTGATISGTESITSSHVVTMTVENMIGGPGTGGPGNGGGGGNGPTVNPMLPGGKGLNEADVRTLIREGAQNAALTGQTTAPALQSGATNYAALYGSKTPALTEPETIHIDAGNTTLRLTAGEPATEGIGEVVDINGAETVLSSGSSVRIPSGNDISPLVKVNWTPEMSQALSQRLAGSNPIMSKIGEGISDFVTNPAGIAALAALTVGPMIGRAQEDRAKKAYLTEKYGEQYTNASYREKRMMEDPYWSLFHHGDLGEKLDEATESTKDVLFTILNGIGDFASGVVDWVDAETNKPLNPLAALLQDDQEKFNKARYYFGEHVKLLEESGQFGLYDDPEALRQLFDLMFEVYDDTFSWEGRNPLGTIAERWVKMINKDLSMNYGPDNPQFDSLIYTLYDVLSQDEDDLSLLERVNDLLRNYHYGIENGLTETIDVTNAVREMIDAFVVSLTKQTPKSEVPMLDVGVELEDGAQEDVQKQLNDMYVNMKVRPVLEGALGKFIEGALFGSFANGMSYVPFDGYLAMLHKGERVMTARENRAYTYNNNTYFGTVNLNNGMEIDALTESIARQNQRQRAGYGA